MSREIRRTPVGWWPPLIQAERFEYGVMVMKLVPRPQHDRSIEDHRALYPDSEPEDPDDYRPAWTDAERNGYQLYETTTEGTPLTPSFATEAELITYLITVGAGRDGTLTRPQAERIVRDGWAPSGTFTANGPRDPYDRPIPIRPR